MSEAPTGYPLAWPHGWPKTNAYARQPWPAKPMPSVSGALQELQNELRRLGAKNIVLSSNVTLGSEKPADPGVVAYAIYDGMQIAIPCDRWNSVAGNLRAIAKTIEAMRGMERWGAKHMIRAMFQGFIALPAPTPSKSWREVLGFTSGSQPTASQIESRRRELARKHHPDLGGDLDRMAEINRAADQALAESSQ